VLNPIAAVKPAGKRPKPLLAAGSCGATTTEGCQTCGDRNPEGCQIVYGGRNAVETSGVRTEVDCTQKGCQKEVAGDRKHVVPRRS